MVLISLLGHVSLQGEHETSTRPKQMSMGRALTSKQKLTIYSGLRGLATDQIVSSFHAFVWDLHRFS